MTHLHTSAIRPTINRFAAALLAILLVAIAPLSASAQELPEGPAQSFPETGYTITDEAIWDYFTERGGAETFGAPVSRTFTLQGLRVQLFQRALLRVHPDGSVQPASLMSEGWLSYSHFNGSTLPAADEALAFVTPVPGQPAYSARLAEFTRSTVPDVWQNQSVGFWTAYTRTPNAAHVWGAPTSMPSADPSNPSFVYQRFERGVLMYNGQLGTTQWMPMGDALKAVLTGTNLPADLAAESAASAFFRQYEPTAPASLARPALLPSTDLSSAFIPDAD